MHFDYSPAVAALRERLMAFMEEQFEIAQGRLGFGRIHHCIRLIDRAVQLHGGAGVSADFGLAAAWASARRLRLADGPDEVHRAVIAKLELARTRSG